VTIITKSPKISYGSIYEYLDLSDYEARIYEFLVREGPSTARRISTLCKVPRTKVYETLKRLIEQGMITDVPTNPKKFMALPPKEVLHYLLESQRTIMKSLRMLISNLQRDYEKSMALVKAFRVELWVLAEDEESKILSNILFQAKRRVDILMPWGFLISFYNVFNGIIDDLAKRKVKVQFYFTSNSKIDWRLCNSMGLHYKIINIDIPYEIIILKVDNERFLMRVATNNGEYFSDAMWILSQSRIICDLLDRMLFKNTNVSSVLLREGSSQVKV